MSELPDAENLKALNASVVKEFRDNRGKVGGQFEGADLLLLTTSGAKSGQRRMSPLAYFRIDGQMIIVGSYAGADIDPAWVHNLRANPRAHVEVGTESFDVTARELPAAEREQTFPKVAAAAPGFADYQGKTSRAFPFFVLLRG